MIPPLLDAYSVFLKQSQEKRDGTSPLLPDADETRIPAIWTTNLGSSFSEESSKQPLPENAHDSLSSLTHPLDSEL